MKCKVSMRFNKEVDFKKVSIHVGNFAVTADGQKFFFDFKKKNFQYVYDVVYEDDTVFVLYEGEELDLEKYPDSLSLIRKLDKITKLERRQRCHDQKNNSKREFSNRTYLYEVEDGIDFFDAVRKASAEFVNTPDGRKIYYKKGSFSWLDFSLLFVAAGAGDQFGGLLGYDSFE